MERFQDEPGGGVGLGRPATSATSWPKDGVLPPLLGWTARAAAAWMTVRGSWGIRGPGRRRAGGAVHPAAWRAVPGP